MAFVNPDESRIAYSYDDEDNLVRIGARKLGKWSMYYFPMHLLNTGRGPNILVIRISVKNIKCMKNLNLIGTQAPNHGTVP